MKQKLWMPWKGDHMHGAFEVPQAGFKISTKLPRVSLALSKHNTLLCQALIGLGSQQFMPGGVRVHCGDK